MFSDGTARYYRRGRQNVNSRAPGSVRVQPRTEYSQHELGAQRVDAQSSLIRRPEELAFDVTFGGLPR
jgi:hypothetical protein